MSQATLFGSCNKVATIRNKERASYILDHYSRSLADKECLARQLDKDDEVLLNSQSCKTYVTTNTCTYCSSNNIDINCMCLHCNKPRVNITESDFYEVAVVALEEKAKSNIPYFTLLQGFRYQLQKTGVKICV